MSQREAPLTPRLADSGDIDGLTATLSLAFLDDPVWMWAFRDPAAFEACWRFVIGHSLRYSTTWVVGPYAAAEVLELDERFEAIHPHDRPHYYLPLLGTHPDHRGHGLGMGLLAHNLAQFDAERIPAYLESTNPANDRRYERLGFVKVGEVSTPDGRHSASTMWRDPAETLEAVELSG